MLYLSPQALQASLLAQDANRLSSGLRAMFPTVDAHEVDAAIEALDTRRCLGAMALVFSPLFLSKFNRSSQVGDSTTTSAHGDICPRAAGEAVVIMAAIV